MQMIKALVDMYLITIVYSTNVQWLYDVLKDPTVVACRESSTC